MAGLIQDFLAELAASEPLTKWTWVFSLTTIVLSYIICDRNMERRRIEGLARGRFEDAFVRLNADTSLLNLSSNVNYTLSDQAEAVIVETTSSLSPPPSTTTAFLPSVSSTVIIPATGPGWGDVELFAAHTFSTDAFITSNSTNKFADILANPLIAGAVVAGLLLLAILVLFFFLYQSNTHLQQELKNVQDKLRALQGLEKNLKEAQRELKDARKGSDKDGLDLKDSRQDLDVALRSLNKSKDSLDEVKHLLDREQQKVGKTHTKFDDGLQKLQRTEAQLDNALKQVNGSQKQLDETCREMKSTLHDLEGTKKLYNGKTKTLNEAQIKLAEALQQIEESQKNLNQTHREMQNIREQTELCTGRLVSAQDKLDLTSQEFNAVEDRNRETQHAIEKASKEVFGLQDQLQEDLKEVRSQCTFVLDRIRKVELYVVKPWQDQLDSYRGIIQAREKAKEELLQIKEAATTLAGFDLKEYKAKMESLEAGLIHAKAQRKEIFGILDILRQGFKGLKNVGIIDEQLPEVLATVLSDKEDEENRQHCEESRAEAEEESHEEPEHESQEDAGKEGRGEDDETQDNEESQEEAEAGSQQASQQESQQTSQEMAKMAEVKAEPGLEVKKKRQRGKRGGKKVRNRALGINEFESREQEQLSDAREQEQDLDAHKQEHLSY